MNLDWMRDGACVTESDPELWHQIEGTSGTQLAVDICTRDCIVAKPCFIYAMRNAVHGVWGATTLTQRETYRKQLGIKAKAVHATNPPRCGTVPGYAAHRRREETPCEPCRAAQARAARAKRDNNCSRGHKFTLQNTYMIGLNRACVECALIKKAAKRLGVPVDEYLAGGAA